MSRELIADLIDLVREMLRVTESDREHKAMRGELRKIKDALKGSLLVLQNS